MLNILIYFCAYLYFLSCSTFNMRKKKRRVLFSPLTVLPWLGFTQYLVLTVAVSLPPFSQARDNITLLHRKLLFCLCTFPLSIRKPETPLSMRICTKKTTVPGVPNAPKTVIFNCAIRGSNPGHPD